MKHSEPLAPRASLALAVVGLAIGGLLMLGSWRSGAERDRIDHAPTCADDQVFTTTDCRATLDGTVVKLTNDKVDLSVDGRQVSMDVTLSGVTSGHDGVPVRVTFYRGVPIHVEGSSLKIDGENSPATHSWNMFNAALFFLIGVPFMAVVNLVIWLARRD